MDEKLLITDFDGTITRRDFYDLAVERLLKPDDIQPWREYEAGRISHFEALSRIFGRIRAPEAVVDALLDDMQVDPGLGEALRALRKAGWTVAVASAGCRWYIDRILRRAGVELEVHANPGVYRPGGPLVMELPTGSPYFSPDTGIDKTALVRRRMPGARVTAYAGDGRTDLPAALLVPARVRFARAALAKGLRERGEAFKPFSIWSDIVPALLEEAL